PDAKLFRDAVGMYGTGAAESEQWECAGVAPAVDRVDSRRIGHVLIDHLMHGPGGACDVEIQWIRELLLDGALGSGDIERHSPAKEVARIQVAKNEVSVGDGRVSAAAAVADRPGLRARRIWPH